MANESLNEQTNNQKDPGITYHQYGFKSAQHAQSSPEAIVGFLERVYDRFLASEKLDKEGIQGRVNKLKNEIQQCKIKKNDLGAEIASKKLDKENKEREIHELELEKIDIQDQGAEGGNSLTFVISAFITIVLTLYLFVFYSSSSYSAFYGVKEGIKGFINPNVFVDAINEGGGVIALILLFPAIFLGLGFLIHGSLEENEKREALDKPKTYITILALLAITLIADGMIGYKIAEGLYLNVQAIAVSEAVSANVPAPDSTPWHTSMVFTDLTFYLVLLLGFVVYVIWGFLLHYVLGHEYLMPQNEKIKLMLEFIDKKNGEKRTELNEILAKMHKLEGEIITCNDEAEEKNKDLIDFENGSIPLNISILKGAIGDFLGGWQAYTSNCFDPKEADSRISKALEVQKNWQEKRIQELTTKANKVQ